MTRASVAAWMSGVLGIAAVAACASAEASPDAPEPALDSGIRVLPEGGADVVSAEDAATRSRCSPAGWCETSLPDEDLTFRSIWPLEGRAFATAESPTVGVKVLEWEDAEGKWKYIDDNSQNQTGLARYVSNIWAASDNEIYYAVAKGTIVHGTRSSPGGPWTWGSYLLEDHSPVHTRHTYMHDYPPESISGASYPTLGVWGTSDGDVYAWYTNTIYHWASEDGGARSWIAEYTADDAVSDDARRIYEELFALGATGANRDDLWFSFVRTNMRADQGSCPVIVRKTRLGYQRIFDGIVGTYRCQGPRAGVSMIGMERGWLTELRMLGEGQLAGVLGGRALVRITSEGDGYAVATATVLSLNQLSDTSRAVYPFFASLYPAPDERLWLGGTGLLGTGMVVSGDNVWDAGGSYQLSTLSLSGAPLEGSMYQIRGTSNTNLWLVGTRHALHKTSL